MNYIDRVNKVKSTEIKMLTELSDGFSAFLVNYSEFRKLIRNFSMNSNIDFSNLSAVYEIIDQIMPDVRNARIQFENISQALDSDIIKEMVAKSVVGDKKNVTIEQVYESIDIASNNASFLSLFVDIYDFIIYTAELARFVQQCQDEVAVFRKIQHSNSYIENKLSQISEMHGFDVDFDDLFKKYIDNEFSELLSTKELKKEIKEFNAQKKSTQVVEVEKVNELKSYEIANNIYDEILEELRALSGLGFEKENIENISNDLEKVKRMFNMPFVYVDDEQIIDFAQNRLNELHLKIGEIKQRIFEHIKYEGFVIADILRENPSFTIRNHFEKLIALCEGFEDLVNKCDFNNIEQLYDLLKKLNLMYAQVEKINHPTYIIDQERFSK